MNRHLKTIFSTLVAVTLQMSSSAAFAEGDGCMIRVAPAEPEPIGMMLALNTTKKVVEQPSLYKRLGGYDAIRAVVDDLMVQLTADPKLGRFWAHRGSDGIKREKQLVVDFIVNKAGGNLNYAGRDMLVSHTGMGIDEKDWAIFMGHLNSTLGKFKVPQQEVNDVVNFMESLKDTMVGV